MRRSLFEFVNRIRAEEKYFEYSRLEIQRLLLSKGECHLPLEHDVADSFGNKLTAILQLNIKTRSAIPQGWTMSLKLHDTRIDCVDHEARFYAADGTIGRGWHRHQWDESEESAERLKVPLNIGTITTTEEFLIRGLSILGIKTNAVDHGQDVLFA